MQLAHIVHVLGAVLWLGSLLTLSRVMLFHAREQDHPVRQRLSVLELKIDRGALIGALLVLGSGIYQIMLWPAGLFRASMWLHHKLSMVIAIFIFHVVLGVRLRQWRTAREGAALSRGLPAAAHGIVALLLIGVLGMVYLGRGL